jgi:hypothetical protein
MPTLTALAAPGTVSGRQQQPCGTAARTGEDVVAERRAWVRRGLVAGALAVVAAACGAGTIDADSLEEQISQGVEEQTGITVSTDCPDSIPLEAGGTFDCTVTAEEDGETITARVVQDDADGNVTWELVE